MVQYAPSSLGEVKFRARRQGQTKEVAMEEASTKLKAYSDEIKNRIDYYVVCVNDFADAHAMSYIDAFDYLKAHKGIDFLTTHYDIEHTYSIEQALEDLSQVCAKNGGVIS